MEKPALKPVPLERFSLFEVGTRTVHPDGYVEVDRAFYAVPDRLLGEEVRAYWDDRLVRIYHQGQCVGVYTKAPAGTFNSLDEYRPAHKPARQQAYQENLLAKAEHIGLRARSWAEAAIEERAVRAYRLLQGNPASPVHPLFGVLAGLPWSAGYSAISRYGAWWSRLLPELPLSCLSSSPMRLSASYLNT